MPRRPSELPCKRICARPGCETRFIPARKCPQQKYCKKQCWTMVHREELREWSRRYRLAHPEKCRERVRQSRLKNREKYSDLRRRWRAENPNYDRDRRLKRLLSHMPDDPFVREIMTAQFMLRSEELRRHADQL